MLQGQIIDCTPIGLMEQFEWPWEDASAAEMEVDHNVLAVITGESIDVLNPEIKETLSNFVLHVFDEIKLQKTKVGAFLDKTAAMEYIKQHQED